MLVLVMVVIFVVVLVLVVLVLVLLMSLIITITAIRENVTEQHDGSHKVVITSRPSTPQLPQHTPNVGGLACKKTAVLRDATDGQLQDNCCIGCYRGV